MLVGRDAELAVLDALITQARAGAGGVVLLTGEPGVGKTRLARAGTEHAAGTTVSWGACRESEGVPPLWPWMRCCVTWAGPGSPPPPRHGLIRVQRLRWAARMRRMSAVSRSLYRSRIACRSSRSAGLL